MSKNICQIIGYFNGGSGQYSMKRTIMKNFTNENYKFYLFIQNTLQHIYTQNYLNNNNNVKIFNSNDKLAQLLKQFKIKYIILSLDFERWYPCISNFNPNNIYYIGHGIIDSHFSESLLIPIYKNWINTKINLLLCSQKQYQIISKFKKNTYKIGSLPQFENLVLTKIHKNQNNILIIGGNSIISRDSNFSNKIINDIISSTYKIYKDKSIILKPPRYMKNPKLVSIPNLEIIPDKDRLLYDFFDSEIIIVAEGGTSYIEALLSNSKVILVLLEVDWNTLNVPINQNPFYYKEMVEFQKFPDDKFPNLLVARNISTLQKYLNTIKSNPEYFTSEPYLKDKDQFIKDSIGEYVPNISKQLLDIIEQIETNS